jgi:hypothetical protein
MSAIRTFMLCRCCAAGKVRELALYRATAGICLRFLIEQVGEVREFIHDSIRSPACLPRFAVNANRTRFLS